MDWRWWAHSSIMLKIRKLFDVIVDLKVASCKCFHVFSQISHSPFRLYFTQITKTAFQVVHTVCNFFSAIVIASTMGVDTFLKVGGTRIEGAQL